MEINKYNLLWLIILSIISAHCKCYGKINEKSSNSFGKRLTKWHYLNWYLNEKQMGGKVTPANTSKL